MSSNGLVTVAIDVMVQGNVTVLKTLMSRTVIYRLRDRLLLARTWLKALRAQEA